MAEMTPHSPLRIGILGSGFMANFHSAELGRTVALPDETFVTYRPPVARSREHEDV